MYYRNSACIKENYVKIKAEKELDKNDLVDVANGTKNHESGPDEEESKSSVENKDQCKNWVNEPNIEGFPLEHIKRIKRQHILK